MVNRTEMTDATALERARDVAAAIARLASDQQASGISSPSLIETTRLNADALWHTIDRVVALEKYRADVSVALALFGPTDVEAAQVAWYVEATKKLDAAIVAHRDARGDDRCWLDDQALYDARADALGEPRSSGDRGLPEIGAFLANCERFHRSRKNGTVWPSYQDLEATIEKLRAEIAAFNDRETRIEKIDRSVPRRLGDEHWAAWVEMGGWLPCPLCGAVAGPLEEHRRIHRDYHLKVNARLLEAL